MTLNVYIRIAFQFSRHRTTSSCAPHVKADLRQEGSTVTSASSAVGQAHRQQTAEPSHARSSSYLAGPMEKRARVDAVRPTVVQCIGCLRSITDVEANFCSKCGRALGVQAQHVEAQDSIAHLDNIGENEAVGFGAWFSTRSHSPIANVEISLLRSSALQWRII